MGITPFTLWYHPEVKEDIRKLGNTEKQQIQAAIEQKLTIAPELFGKPLRNSLHGYQKLRVGDYRIIFRIEKTLVKIFTIQHRSVVYQHFEKRKDR